jgi:cupin 2 domain-containing protein
MASLLEGIPKDLRDELFERLAEGDGVYIERIVSDGHASAPGFVYDQQEDEWVLLVRGGAELKLFDPDETVSLRPLEHLYIGAHRRHRVEKTEPFTIWLAVHFRRSPV